MEIKLTDDNFKQEVLESKLPCLVDFWAEWCMPCQTIAPAVKEIAKKYKGKLKVGKLNVDDNPDTASNYEIRSIPVLAIFNNGKIANKIIGAIPKIEIEDKIEQYI